MACQPTDDKQSREHAQDEQAVSNRIIAHAKKQHARLSRALLRVRSSSRARFEVGQSGLVSPHQHASATRGALTTSGTVSGRTSADHQGTLIIAIDVSQLRELEGFTSQVEEFIDYVKSSELEAGAPPIRVPGEKTPVGNALPMQHCVAVNAKTWGNLQGIANKLDVKMPVQNPGRGSSFDPRL